jgi:hypothetical protein
MRNHLQPAARARSSLLLPTMLAGFAIAAAANACTGERGDDIEEIATQRSSIRNGTIVQPWPNGTPAYTRAIVKVNGCAGTLIDPEWVLFTRSGFVNPCASPQVGHTVTSVRPSGDVTRTIDRIVRHNTSFNAPDHAELLHLNAPINDAPPTPIYWGATSTIIGNQVTCYGYGADATAGSCTSNANCSAGFSCWAGLCQSFTGDLRSATMTTAAEPDQVNWPGTFDVLLNSSGQTLLAGDLSGPCYYQGQLAAIASANFHATTLNGAAVLSIANFRSWMIATMRGQRTRLFQGVDNNVVYFLDAANQLWRENGTSANKTLVDSNVRTFHAINSSVVYVLGFDNNLWNEQPDSSNRTHVDGSVRAFQGIDTSNVLVLGTDGNLWREIGSFTNRTFVDGSVLNFRGVGALPGPNQHIYVLGTDQVLWNETGSNANRFEVDSNVMDFSPVDNSRAYVLGFDSVLWNEVNTSANRTQVDATVQDMQAIDSSVVYVLGQDNVLWRETGNSSNRTLVDSSVLRFQAMDATTVYVMGQDGNLWREIGTASNRTLVDHR